MNTGFEITEDTPISVLTVGQQKELFKGWCQEFFGKPFPKAQSTETKKKRYVYGIAGISSLFQVSYVTACKLKEGMLKPAIMQQGRKIICDADLAIELFRENSGK